MADAPRLMAHGQCVDVTDKAPSLCLQFHVRSRHERDFRGPECLEQAMELVHDVYVVSAKFPQSETYGLAIQMRRAAVSIPSNIAEGKGRSTGKDFAHFLCLARGSLHELQTQILIAARLEYMQPDMKDRLIEQTKVVGRLLHGLLSYANEQVTV